MFLRFFVRIEFARIEILAPCATLASGTQLQNSKGPFRPQHRLTALGPRISLGPALLAFYPGHAVHAQSGSSSRIQICRRQATSTIWSSGG